MGRYAPPMGRAKLITGAAAAVVVAGAAAAPRVWRRLRRGGSDDAWESDFSIPDDATFGDPEAPVDEAANAALREELREKVEAIAEEPVEADLIVEGVPGSDPAAEAARARLRDKAQAAKDAFRS